MTRPSSLGREHDADGSAEPRARHGRALNAVARRPDPRALIERARESARLPDDDRSVAVCAVRLSHETIRTGEHFLFAVYPSRALPRAGTVFLPADDDLPVAGNTVGAARSSGDRAAEIDHARRFLPPERSRDIAAVPRQADDHLAVGAHAIRGAEQVVARRGVRSNRAEQPPLGGPLPDAGLFDLSRIEAASDDRASVAARCHRDVATDVDVAGGRHPIKAAARSQAADDDRSVRVDVERQGAGRELDEERLVFRTDACRQRQHQQHKRAPDALHVL